MKTDRDYRRQGETDEPKKRCRSCVRISRCREYFVASREFAGLREDKDARAVFKEPGGEG